MKAVSPVIAALLVLLAGIAVATLVFAAARLGVIGLGQLSLRSPAPSDVGLAWWSYNESSGLLEACIVNTGETFARLTRVRALSRLGATLGEISVDALLEPRGSITLRLHVASRPGKLAVTYVFPGGMATKIYDLQ